MISDLGKGFQFYFKLSDATFIVFNLCLSLEHLSIDAFAVFDQFGTLVHWWEARRFILYTPLKSP